MQSHITTRFRKLFKELPQEIRKCAKESYSIWKINPFHPSLHFKEIEGYPDMWSVRITIGYRAIGIRDGEEITWSWIGSHGDYDKQI